MMRSKYKIRFLSFLQNLKSKNYHLTRYILQCEINNNPFVPKQLRAFCFILTFLFRRFHHQQSGFTSFSTHLALSTNWSDSSALYIGTSIKQCVFTISKIFLKNYNVNGLSFQDLKTNYKTS